MENSMIKVHSRKGDYFLVSVNPEAFRRLKEMPSEADVLNAKRSDPRSRKWTGEELNAIKQKKMPPLDFNKIKKSEDK